MAEWLTFDHNSNTQYVGSFPVTTLSVRIYSDLHKVKGYPGQIVISARDFLHRYVWYLNIAEKND